MSPPCSCALQIVVIAHPTKVSRGYVSVIHAHTMHVVCVSSRKSDSRNSFCSPARCRPSSRSLIARATMSSRIRPRALRSVSLTHSKRYHSCEGCGTARGYSAGAFGACSSHLYREVRRLPLARRHCPARGTRHVGHWACAGMLLVWPFQRSS